MNTQARCSESSVESNNSGLDSVRGKKGGENPVPGGGTKWGTECGDKMMKYDPW